MTDTAQQTAKENQKPKTFAAKAFAAQNTSGSMSPHTLQRREPRPQDVQIEILYLRRVPFRSASGAQRMGGRSADGLSRACPATKLSGAW